MKTAMELLKCLIMASLCALLVTATVTIWKIPGIVVGQATEIRVAAVGEIDAARRDLNTQVGTAVEDANKRLSGVIGQVDKTRRNADMRTGAALDLVRLAIGNVDIQATAIRRDVDGQLTALNQTLSLTASGISEVLVPVGKAASQVNESLPLFLDCDHNSDCAFNRFQGVSKAFEQTARTIATEVPRVTAHVDSVAASADSVAADIKREADQLTRPQSVWSQIRSWLLTVARIYGAI